MNLSVSRAVILTSRFSDTSYDPISPRNIFIHVASDVSFVYSINLWELKVYNFLMNRGSDTFF